jgi:hypothetical protein
LYPADSDTLDNRIVLSENLNTPQVALRRGQLCGRAIA